jgi:hypothetical protein
MTSVSPDDDEAAVWRAREARGAAGGRTRGSGGADDHRARPERLGTACVTADRPATAHGRAQ